jgi:K+-transporting ATPase ATPase C chain
VTHDLALLQGPGPVPADAVTTSASGLDPDISPENALMQVARVAAARKLPTDRVAALVADHTNSRQFGFIGERRVNVLALNIALDKMSAN